jgi:hypothetical protein
MGGSLQQREFLRGSPLPGCTHADLTDHHLLSYTTNYLHFHGAPIELKGCSTIQVDRHDTDNASVASE